MNPTTTKTTIPAPDSGPVAPALQLPSRLTLLAIEAGVSVADAAAYNAGRTRRAVCLFGEVRS